VSVCAVPASARALQAGAKAALRWISLLWLAGAGERRLPHAANQPRAFRGILRQTRFYLQLWCSAHRPATPLPALIS